MGTGLFIKNKYFNLPKTVWLIFFLIFFAAITSTSLAQTDSISIHLNNKSVLEVLSSIEKRSSYIFIYTHLDTEKKVSLQFDNKPISLVLDKIAEETGIQYEILGRQIILKEKNESYTKEDTQKKIRLRGMVKDEDNEPVISASVLLKETHKGTATALDGSFALEVPVHSTLIISYLGYQTQEIRITNQEQLTVSLIPASTLIDEVVVTALGMKRENKALGYSIQELKSGEIVEARENNVINSLSGKLAGVDISRTGNGPGGSSRIVIRGNNSIGGNNQPMVVVDGIPINNFSGGANNEWGGEDRGNGLADINPDDIESISVLKGAAAAALYGSRAGNGVLMITTKKGSKTKGLGVTLSSNIMFETPLIKPIMQNEYGQGSNGLFSSNGNYSWGPRMEGQSWVDWTGTSRPYLPYDNDITDYLRVGVTTNNTLSVNSETEKISFLGTAAYMENKGSIPTNLLTRTNLSLRTIVHLSENLSLDAKINYIKQKAQNRVKLSGSPENIFLNYLMMPRNIHYSDLKGGSDETGKLKRWTTDEVNYILNPYWSNRYNLTEDERDRFIGFLALEYNPFPWLNAKLRIGEDMYWNKVSQKYSAGTPFSGLEESGDYWLGTSNFMERNMDALISASKDNWWNSKFSGSLSIGGNMMYQQGDSYTMSAGKLTIPNFFAISNGRTPMPDHYTWEKAVNSLYAFAQLNYGDFIYLDLTTRNDWSSTLPKENQSFFYPSISSGWIVSEMLKNYQVKIPSFITFAKIRASYAQVGNDAGVYQLLPTYGIFTVIGDIKGASPASFAPLSWLKPELIKSTEFGIDFRMFQNRLGIDLAWYKKDATNQILALPVSSTAGKLTRGINAGSIQNRGIELILRGTPVKTRHFQWDVTVNYARNKNEIKELHPEAKEFLLAKTDFINVVAIEGQSYGDMYGRAYQRNSDGKILIDDSGLPLLESDLSTRLGNYLPLWTGGWMNHFSYKNVSLNFLIDVKWKGNIYINSLARGAKYGTTQMTLEGRKEWYESTGGIIAEGVTKDGKPNQKIVNPQVYWDRVSTASEEFIYDASSIRLRELTLGYSIPRRVLAKTPFTNLKLSLVGRNLWLIKSEIPGFDPESSYSTGNGQGIEYGSMPAFRTFGFNLNVSF